MAYAVAVLLVSSLTSVGLFAIWAAASHAHWFWRTMGFLAAISLPLLIPAYEPFVAFLLQGMVVAACIHIVRWRSTRRRGEPLFSSQFSLQTILLVMVPAAFLIAAGVELLRAEEMNWMAATQIGFISGLTSLLGLWLAKGRLRLSWRVAIGTVAALGLTLLLQWNEWFVDQMVSFDFESNLNSYDWRYIPLYVDINNGLIWLTAIILSVLCTATMLWLVGPGSETFQTSRSMHWKLAIGLLYLLLLTPCFIAFYLLIDKLPIPEHELPIPNGYDDFIAAAQMLPARVIVSSGNFDPETTALDVVRKGVDEIRPALERIRMGLSKESWKPHDYESDELLFGINEAFRKLARGFRAEGKLAEREAKDPSAAATAYLDLINYGSTISRGGMHIDRLVGVACNGFGWEYLYSLPDSLPSEEFIRIVKELARIESQIEPFDELNYRDKVWNQHGFGWVVHLQQDLEHVFDDRLKDRLRMIYNRELACLRLLQIEFALRAWRKENQDWPPALERLVPDYLLLIPSDPYSEGNPLKYVRTDNGYFLYSVGANGLDELGKAPEPNTMGFGDLATGDLRLDVMFAPEPSAQTVRPTLKVGGENDEEAKEL